jgi:uncharacterized protein (TIGR02466 family)
VDAVQQELQELYDSLSFDKVEGWDIRTASFTKHISLNILGSHKPKLFLIEVFKNIQQYLQEINVPQYFLNNYDLIIEESWFAKMEKGEFHWQHSHAHYELSGVYYMKANGDDNAICFHTPNKLSNSSRLMHGLGTRRLVTPQPGLLLLFPSWLEHNVPTNQTDEERVSLAFNISMRPKP